MTDENQAEQAASGITFDNEVDNAISQDANEGSAPQVDENPAVETPEDKVEEIKKEADPQDGFQKRINKVTADKYEQQRRADAAEAKNAELEAKIASNTPQAKEPELSDPDIDYDEDKLLQARINYGVNKAVAETTKNTQQTQKEERSAQAKADINQKFTERAKVFAEDKKDYMEVMGKVPILQPSVLDAVMERENGPELVYFLGNHLDIADSIINMNPVAAGIKIGEISRKLAEPKQIKPSGAPDPIDPLKGSGVTATDRGPKGATFE